MTVLRRGAISCFALALAAGFFWYAFCTFSLSARIESFAVKASSRFFPAALLSAGHGDFYSLLDPAAASRSYRKAIQVSPALVDAWISLARVEMAMEHPEEARRILRIISAPISSVSSWKWQELLLAFELRDEEYFRSCFNFILERLPHRVHEASLLAARFYGSWEAVVPRLDSQNQPLLLIEALRAGAPAAALALWKSMEERGVAPDEALTLSFCQFLIEKGRLDEAMRVWQRYTQEEKVRVYDGGFESAPLNKAFGWRFSINPEVVIDRSTEAPYSGGSCLHLQFKGAGNLNFHHVSQIVPVRPGGSYRLHFARKSRDLTTDQGVFLQVSGYKCDGLRVSSETVLGTTPWISEEMRFTVPPECEAIVLGVLRKESLKMDNKISGEYWLDAVELSSCSEE